MPMREVLEVAANFALRMGPVGPGFLGMVQDEFALRSPRSRPMRSTPRSERMELGLDASRSYATAAVRMSAVAPTLEL